VPKTRIFGKVEQFLEKSDTNKNRLKISGWSFSTSTEEISIEIQLNEKNIGKARIGKISLLTNQHSIQDLFLREMII